MLKGLPFLLDQAHLPLLLSDLNTVVPLSYQRSVSGGQMLSQHLPGAERLVQATPTQRNSIAFCLIRTVKLFPLPCCRPAAVSTGCPGVTWVKSNESIKGRRLSKRLFSPVRNGSQHSPWLSGSAG